MLCMLRTIGAGVAVLALCFLLASMSWQFLLIGFAFASVAWACWSCSVQLTDSGSLRKSSVAAKPKALAPLPFNSPSRGPRANIYVFPASESGSQGRSY